MTVVKTVTEYCDSSVCHSKYYSVYILYIIIILLCIYIYIYATILSSKVQYFIWSFNDICGW